MVAPVGGRDEPIEASFIGDLEERDSKVPPPYCTDQGASARIAERSFTLLASANRPVGLAECARSFPEFATENLGHPLRFAEAAAVGDFGH